VKFEKLKNKLGIKLEEPKSLPKPKKITKVAKKSFRNTIGDLYHTKRL
jgi:hypothetical protein